MLKYLVGNDILFRTQAFGWHRHFRKGRESVEDCRHFGCPQTSHTAENIEKVSAAFVQTRGMPNSPSEMIPDMLDWRQIWGSIRPRKEAKSRDSLVRPLPYEDEHCLVEKWLLEAVA
ncbi:hypothetical protein TNCV_718051 [Trichonephila clavipes]|nr:hypothetical protein TNCV_718051 [Trichonephila clavipes]